jgi:hypothetical protein
MNWLRDGSCRPFGTHYAAGILVPWADAHGYIISPLRGWCVPTHSDDRDEGELDHASIYTGWLLAGLGVAACVALKYSEGMPSQNRRTRKRARSILSSDDDKILLIDKRDQEMYDDYFTNESSNDLSCLPVPEFAGPSNHREPSHSLALATVDAVGVSTEAIPSNRTRAAVLGRAPVELVEPRSRQTKPTRKLSSRLTQAALMLLAVFCFWNAFPDATPQNKGGSTLAAAGPRADLRAGFAEAGSINRLVSHANEPRYLTKSIKDIYPVVDRVLADNPETPGQAPSDFGEIDPSNWRLLKAITEKPEGGSLTVTLARPLWWFAEVNRSPSNQIWLDFEELGIHAWFDVQSIAACPTPKSGQGRLVTGRFEHSSGNILDIQVAGAPEPIGTTSNHPFWSEDRQEFVQAGTLKPGETLRLYDGSTAAIKSIKARENPEAVYNIEVDGEHVYLVGERGILVHNLYKDANGRWHRNNGQFAKRLGRPRANKSRPTETGRLRPGRTSCTL